MEPDPVVEHTPVRRDEAEITEWTIRRYVDTMPTISVVVRYCEPGTSTTGPRDRPFWTISLKHSETTKWIQLPAGADRGREARDVAHEWADLLEREMRARRELVAAERAAGKYMADKRVEGQGRLGTLPQPVAEQGLPDRETKERERRRAEDDRLNTPG